MGSNETKEDSIGIQKRQRKEGAGMTGTERCPSVR